MSKIWSDIALDSENISYFLWNNIIESFSVSENNYLYVYAQYISTTIAYFEGTFKIKNILEKFDQLID